MVCSKKFWFSVVKSQDVRLKLDITLARAFFQTGYGWKAFRCLRTIFDVWHGVNVHKHVKVVDFCVSEHFRAFWTFRSQSFREMRLMIVSRQSLGMMMPMTARYRRLKNLRKSWTMVWMKPIFAYFCRFVLSWEFLGAWGEFMYGTFPW